MSKKVAEVIVETLVSAGVKHCYGIVGDTLNTFATSLSKRRMAVMACQAAITQRGVAVLILPVDVADADAAEELPYGIHVNRPVIRPSATDLDQMAALLAEGSNIAIYAGAGCRGAHDEVVELAGRLKAPVAHTSRGKDALEYDNPHNIGMTGVIGMEAAYHCILNCDTLLLLGTDFAWQQRTSQGVRLTGRRCPSS